MSRRPNYFKIGLFVIVAVALILAAVIIFGGGIFAQKRIYFETYFDGSVSGLNVGAPVERRGVRIGRVEKITFAADEYDIPGDPLTFSKYERYVMVVASVGQENLPELSYEEKKARLERLISNGLRIRLAVEILTGVAYLEGEYVDPNRFPLLEIAWEPRHFYVPSAPSVFTTLKDSVDKILHRLEKIDTEKMAGAVQDVLDSLNEILQNANVPEVMTQLNETLQRIDKLIATRRPDIEQTLENLKEVSANLKDLTETLKRHPSKIMFSQPPPKSEALK
jgi:phospholipid/cholesterol/gamma-HCH transport system substrate-binding protein/paraquat-inducible protein B